MAVKTELTLDISEYIKSLNTVVDAGKQAAEKIANSFKSVGSAGAVPKIDTKDLNSLVSSYNSAKTQAALFLSQQKEIANALKFSGQAGSEAYKEVAANITKAEKELARFNEDVAKTSFMGGLEESFKKGQKDATSGGGIFGSLAGRLGELATPAGLATAAIGGLTAGIAATVSIGREFETALAGVGSITGQSSEDLAVLGDNARDLAKKFGGDATTQLASFQGVLSRFGADLAKSPEQLKTLADNINVLGKAGGLDAAQSMDALTNSMLQFGVDVENPNEAAQESTRFINALAKSAEVGAAEIPQVTDAILVAGVAAKKANVSFEETNAAIQVLAAGGKVGAEAGTALRNVLGKIAGEEVIPKEALDKLKSLGVDMNKVSDTSKPLSERLKELGKASKDATAFAQVFGSENAAAASILADGAVTISDWNKEITGSNAAFDQAAINMNTFSERISRAQAQIEDVAIGAWTSLAPSINAAFDVISSVITTAVVGWYEYVKEAFIVPLTNVWDTIIESLSPLKDLFLELFGGASSEGIKFTDAMRTVGKVVGVLINLVLTPLKLTFQAIGTVIRFVVGSVQAIKVKFEETYKSSEVFRDIVTEISNAFKAVVGWIGEAIDYISDFFNAIEKKPKEAPFKDVEKSAENASESVSELNDELTKETAVPNTEKTKKEYADLTDYILGLKDKITDISFQVGIAEQDSVIKTLEKQIKEISTNPNLTQVAKLNLSIELETQKAISESEKELEVLAEANRKAIESIEKEFETKKKGAKKSDIIEAEKAKNDLINAETSRFYDNALKIVETREEKLNTIRVENGNKVLDYTKKQSEILQELQIENIADEKERNYQKELLALRNKFEAEYELYKDNKDIQLQLEQKFITDYQNLNQKFATKDIDTTNELLKANLKYVSDFNKSIASIQITDNSGRLDGIKQESKELQKALNNNEISYETYIEKIVELEKEKLDLQKKTNSDSIGLIINTSKVFLDNIVTQVSAYTDYASRKNAIDEQIYENEKLLRDKSLTDEVKRLEIQRNIDNLRSKQTDDNLTTLGNALGQTKSLFEENTIAYKAMAIAEASIATYLGATKVLGQLPVPLNFITAGLITAAGLANVAKIAGFKKGGYTGDGGTSDTAGVVHGREFVAHATATKQYRDVLERINKNDLSNVFIGANGKIIEPSNIGIVHSNITRNDAPRLTNNNNRIIKSMEKLSNELRNNTTNKHTQFAVEIDNKLKMRGDNIESGLTKIRRKKLQRF